MKRFIAAAVLIPVIVLAATSVASADISRPCTAGDAQANFQAPFENLFENLGVCQFRIQRDGATHTFCEGDVILGGLNLFLEYQALGISREEAIAILEPEVDRVWLDGVEVPLKQTAWKDGIHPVLGKAVYQHRAFITQFSPGDHVSYWEATYPGEPTTLTATVTLHVLPATNPACS